LNNPFAKISLLNLLNFFESDLITFTNIILP